MIRIIVLILTLVLILTACAETDTSPAPTPTEKGTYNSTTASATTTAQTLPDTFIIREPTEDNPLQFDFDEVIKTLEIKGHKVSLPCTIDDLGEDFSYNEELPFIDEENEMSCYGLVYMEKI